MGFKGQWLTEPITTAPQYLQYKKYIKHNTFTYLCLSCSTWLKRNCMKNQVQVINVNNYKVHLDKYNFNVWDLQIIERLTVKKVDKSKNSFSSQCQQCEDEKALILWCTIQSIITKCVLFTEGLTARKTKDIFSSQCQHWEDKKGFDIKV